MFASLFKKYIASCIGLCLIVLVIKWEVDSCVADRGSKIVPPGLELPTNSCPLIRDWHDTILAKGSGLEASAGILSVQNDTSFGSERRGSFDRFLYIAGISSLPILLAQSPFQFEATISVLILILLMAIFPALGWLYLEFLWLSLFPTSAEGGPRRRTTAANRLLTQGFRRLRRSRGKFE